ncbi:ATP-binding cassette domain-containing protein [Bogoriella caseilytica]|uniref:UvrABC system protein A n=1 Tax=Bogoriella caseilytica TaxID=56055 RepID=A0A3N2BBK5_9MICO|nr:excinuclease ABC subunit UvrA [Bogoriella caseilytica]ROR72618.1 excinuclease ABC A subunit [Bogoriella caseilytica]
MDPHPADGHDIIRVRGARENNLRGIDLDIPKRRLSVFTGVSGSGKSSLVFGTIAAESRRLIDETYSTFVQGFMPNLPRPEVDSLEGLTTAILVDQERMGANPRSTLGTVTDAYAMLRSLFSRLGTPYIGGPTAFSFNIPTTRASGVATGPKGEKKIVKDAVYLGGMCPECEGRGAVSDLDLTHIIDESRSLEDGAILAPGYTPDGWMVAAFKAVIPSDIPISRLTAEQREDLLHAEPRKVKIDKINVTYEGLIPKLRKSMFSKDPDSLQPHLKAFVERASVLRRCSACAGTRLNDSARSCTIAGRNIGEVSAMQVSDLADWLRSLDGADAVGSATDGATAEGASGDVATATLDVSGVQPLIAALLHLLDALVQIGLGYLSLDRPSGTLSGGEAQRTKMVRHLGSALTDVTYVFDEPTIGLHPHDIARMNSLLLELRDKGNTVLVVEHKPETIAIADHVVDMGPGAGSAGGEVVYQGDVAGLRQSGTLTGEHLAYTAALKDQVRTPTGSLPIRGANTHNLQDVDVDLPLGVLTVITGVAGSGKSSLIHSHLVNSDRAERAGVVTVDQSAIKGSRRSNPATYTGVLEPIRKAFAKANGVKPALFSANSEGACPTCKGAGVIITELGFMESVSTPCEDCGGRRYQAAVLDLRLGGLNIAEVLDLPVAEARPFFAAGEARTPAAEVVLGRLEDVGLGYLRLGQPLNTLSGGERQRVKLAMRMKDNGGVYVLDEPTTGLHLADVENLLRLLDRLVDAGRSVIVIEHHQAVMAHADWIIDLGPGAGHDGGRVVFEGTPAELVRQSSTLTGKHLAAYIGGSPS